MERACKSPTLSREDKATKRTVLRVNNFSDTDCNSSKGLPNRPSKTIVRSQEGTHAGRKGLSRLKPCIKREAKEWRPTEAPPTGGCPTDMATTYILRVAGVTPSEKMTLKKPMGKWTGSRIRCLHHEAKSLHLKAYKRLVEGALELIMMLVVTVAKSCPELVSTDHA